MLLQNAEEVGADSINFLRMQIDEVTKVTGAPAARAAALMGWYWQKPWSDTQLAPIIGDVYRFVQPVSKPLQPTPREVARITQMLQELGESGQAVMRKRAEEISE